MGCGGRRDLRWRVCVPMGWRRAARHMIECIERSVCVCAPRILDACSRGHSVAVCDIPVLFVYRCGGPGVASASVFSCTSLVVSPLTGLLANTARCLARQAGSFVARPESSGDSRSGAALSPQEYGARLPLQ